MDIALIQKKIDSLSTLCFSDLLSTFDIKLVYDEQMNKNKMDSMLKTYQTGAVIFMKTNLSDEYRKFLLLHELGHFLLHYEKGMKYSFYLSKYKNRLEIEANTFACMYLLQNEEYQNMNVIELLKNRGVPDQIAKSFFESYRTNQN